MEHFGISVLDIQRSVRWYQDIFGFQVVKEFEKPELQIKGAVMKRGDLSLEILQPYSPKELPAEDSSLVALLQRIGANHFAISAEDVKSLYNELKSQKAELVTELIEQRFFFCKDPDGTLIEIKQCQQHDGVTVREDRQTSSNTEAKKVSS
ncbi:MAG: VOC family protein [Syntrophorhabdales bacterium]|jgi:methylmalonyl-CoA/ethylmalonyl-CoA epimerase